MCYTNYSNTDYNNRLNESLYHQAVYERDDEAQKWGQVNPHTLIMVSLFVFILIGSLAVVL